VSWSERLLAGEGERATEKQLAILVAAAELFAERGYADTTTRLIAQRAKVSDSAIYTYYATKIELLLHISQLIIRNIVKLVFNEGLSELFERHYERPEDFLRAFFANRLELIEDNIIPLKLLLQEALFQMEIRQAFLQAIMESRFLLGLAGLKERGLSAIITDQELAMLILSSFVGFIFSHYIITPEIWAPAHKQNDGETGVRGVDPRAYISYMTYSLAWVWVRDGK
jgi:AcrR family transcriptional regulator